MPLHEYTCRKCSHHFEDLVFGDQTPVCPACQAGDVERQLSVVSVGRSGGREAPPLPPQCGGCGDPRGPGACGMMPRD